MKPEKDTRNIKHQMLPVKAGIMAACGGLCMKIGINNVDMILKKFGAHVEDKSVFIWTIYFIQMVAFIGAGIVFNATNQKYYVIALKYIGASLTVAISFIVNYIWSVIMNYITFGGVPTFGQYIGSIMFVIGLYFISFQNCFSKKHLEFPTEDYKVEMPPQSDLPQDALDKLEFDSFNSENNTEKIQNIDSKKNQLESSEP